MIGNDVVDLQVAARESNWKRPRLHLKIFSENEQEILQNSEDPEQSFWLLWAMKEAACKAHQRCFLLPRKFNPKSFRCTLNSPEDSGSSGIVQVDNCHYFTTAKISAKAIHCVASAENSEVQERVFKGTHNLKQELISEIAGREKLSPEGLQIEKDRHFIPHLMLYGKKQKIPFSISHHGNYSAYVLAVN